MISIIIPTLNEEKYLPKLLDSLVSQTDRNFEIIVVDGGSQDKTVSVATRYGRKFQKITVVKSDRASLPYQRNLGAKAAKGEWFVFVDADSVFLPYFVAQCRRCIKERTPDAIAVWFRPDSEVSGDALITLLANVTMELSLMFHRPLTPGPLTIVSRRAFELIHGYDVTHEFSEDLDFGIRLYRERQTIVVLRETLVIWSLRRMRKEGSLSVLRKYVATGLAAFIVRHPLKFMPGYTMGGHVYEQSKARKNRPLLAKINKQIALLWKELIA